MFFFIDICNIKPVHLFSRGSISFPYLTWYKINGQLSGNNLMLIFVRLFPSKSKKANEKNPTVSPSRLCYITRAKNSFYSVHRCWELKTGLKCCSGKYKEVNKTLL